MQEGPLKGKRNTYAGDDLTNANLMGTVYVAAAFEDCTFRNTKLVKINFGTSTFVDCQFEGELREVRFWRSDLFSRPGFQETDFPVNEMMRVDFSRAKLRDVEFRGLSLDQVQLPSDAEHFMIKSFMIVLGKLIDALEQQEDQTARILIAYLDAFRKGTVPGAPGVLNKQALQDAAGKDAVPRVLRLLEQFGVKTS